MYYNFKVTKNNLNIWKSNLSEFQKEIINVNPKILISWPEKDLYDKNMTWKIIPICYTVPSDNIKNQIWINSVEKFIPKIYNFVKSLKNVRTALISKMGKNVSLKPHQGWADVANHVLRCHLPIIVEYEKSGIIVSGVKKNHMLGDVILFDDSLMHSGFNESNQDRYILIIDFVRPKNIPKGVSTIESSKQLLKLSSFYKIINNVYENLCI